MKLVQCSRATAEEHYAEHKGKPFYEGLVQFITSGPAVAMVWEGALCSLHFASRRGRFGGISYS